MIDTRTTERFPASQVERLDYVFDRHDGMHRVIARLASGRSAIVWEPSLFRLPEENRDSVALHHLVRLAAYVESVTS